MSKRQRAPAGKTLCPPVSTRQLLHASSPPVVLRAIESAGCSMNSPVDDHRVLTWPSSPVLKTFRYCSFSGYAHPDGSPRSPAISMPLPSGRKEPSVARLLDMTTKATVPPPASTISTSAAIADFTLSRITPVAPRLRRMRDGTWVMGHCWGRGARGRARGPGLGWTRGWDRGWYWG